MPNSKPQSKVSRLLDIIVEEISLVDRAANKRRFLIVKRSESMADSDVNAAQESVTDNSATEADSAIEAEEGQEATASESHPLLGTAVIALESLTSTVELLSTVGADDPRLAPLAEELKVTAERLLEQAGVQSEPEEAEETEQDKDDAFAQNITAAREALARLGALTAKTAKSDDEPPAVSASTNTAPTVEEPSTPSPLDNITEALGALNASFKTLAQTVKEQQQRLALVEKNVGLPNSSQSPEPVAKSEPEDAAWPLDLNRPMDRESVDKSISFHDI